MKKTVMLSLALLLVLGLILSCTQATSNNAPSSPVAGTWYSDAWEDYSDVKLKTRVKYEFTDTAVTSYGYLVWLDTSMTEQEKRDYLTALGISPDMQPNTWEFLETSTYIINPDTLTFTSSPSMFGPANVTLTYTLTSTEFTLYHDIWDWKLVKVFTE